MKEFQSRPRPVSQIAGSRGRGAATQDGRLAGLQRRLNAGAPARHLQFLQRVANGRDAPVQRVNDEEELLQGKALQRMGDEEELLQGTPVQRIDDEEEPLQGKAVQRMDDEEELLQGKSVQRMDDEEELLQGKAVQLRAAPYLRPTCAPLQRKGGGDGLPDDLRAGIESLSGLSMDGVRVHRNSTAPARVGAHAYAQGTDIHLAPGQDRHLPHEAWHVVQQAQGRVRPTMDVAGTPVNDDPGLEAEADRMGDAAQRAATPAGALLSRGAFGGTVAQRVVIRDDGMQVNLMDVAFAWKGGGDYAVTPSIINGHEIPPSANKQGMVLYPALREDHGGLYLDPRDQIVSYRIDAPVKGPWVLAGPHSLDELDAFAGLGSYTPPPRSTAESALNYGLIVRGDPSDDALRDAIVDHEIHHVHEQYDVVEDVLDPWDAAATDFAGRRFRDPLTAFLAFRNDVGESQDVADRVVEELRSKGLAFHATEEGKEPDVLATQVDTETMIYTVTLRAHTG